MNGVEAVLAGPPHIIPWVPRPDRVISVYRCDGSYAGSTTAHAKFPYEEDMRVTDLWKAAIAIAKDARQLVTLSQPSSETEHP